MVCSGSSIESLHVLGTLQYLLESALQVKYHLLYSVERNMSLEMHRLSQIRWLVSQTENTSS